MRVLEPPDGTLAPLSGGAPVDLAPAAATNGQGAAPTPQGGTQAALQPLALEPAQYPLVVVHWLDAWYDAGEQTEDDWRDDYPIQTVGYLVRDTGAVVSIAQEVLPDGEGFRAVTHIPKGMVQRVDRLVPEVPGGAAVQPA